MISHRQELDSETLAELTTACEHAYQHGRDRNEHAKSTFDILRSFRQHRARPTPAPASTQSVDGNATSNIGILTSRQLNRTQQMRSESANTTYQPELSENSFRR